MPKLKQPTFLEAIAMKALVEFAVRFCDQLSTEGTLQMLREGISVIKKDVCSRIPWCFLPEFCATFLEKFSEKSREKRHLEAASEILLDVEFVGLRCNSNMLRNLNPQHLNRLRGLVELDMSSEEELPGILANYHLNDITTLYLPGRAMNHDLTVIGQNCSKLRVLKLHRSLSITDEGLRALSSCSDLRVVDISGCFQVTNIGVNLLISAHDKLEELCCGDWFGIDATQSVGCNFLFTLDRPSSVMKRFYVKTNELTNENLRSIVSMFPNLTHFKTICKSVEDLSILKSMSKLEGISIKFDTSRSDSNTDRAWQSLKELLTFVGGNIKTLTFRYWGRIDIIHISEQTGLDFIFRNCPDIEYLKFDYGDYDLVIPPFEKLKTLRLKRRRRNNNRYTIELSNIGAMLNLEVLSIRNFEICSQFVEAIVLDDVRFPKLRRIEACTVSVEKIEAIARNNNLDFEIL